jgi:hypothetical protein
VLEVFFFCLATKSEIFSTFKERMSKQGQRSYDQKIQHLPRAKIELDHRDRDRFQEARRGFEGDVGVMRAEVVTKNCPKETAFASQLERWESLRVVWRSEG